MDDEKWSEIANQVRSLRYYKKILLLVTGGSSYSNEIYEILLNLQGVDITYALTDNGSCVHGANILSKLGKPLNTPAQVYPCVRDTDLVLLPFMTRNTLTKSALGIADNLVMTAVSESLMMQKPIIAADSSWNPKSEHNRLMKLDRNLAYVNMLNQYKTKLEEFGMVFSPIYELEECIQSYITGTSPVPSSQVLASCDVNTNASAGTDMIEFVTYEDLAGKQSFALPKNARLTDLAKDYAAENNITIISEG